MLVSVIIELGQGEERGEDSGQWGQKEHVLSKHAAGKAWALAVGVGTGSAGYRVG